MGTTEYKMEIDNPMKEKAIKTAVNDISTDLSSISSDVKSLNNQLPTLVATRTEINEFKGKVENYDKKLSEATAVIKRGVDVRGDPAKLSGEDVQMLKDIRVTFERWNRRWENLWKTIANTGKIKVYLTGILSSALSVCITLLVCYDSSYIWAHRAFVASEAKHDENPSEEYFNAFSEMQGNRKTRKETKKRIEGMEAEAKYIKRLERILSGYTEEELEVREYKYRIKSEQMVYLVCYHSSTDKNANYRMHTTPEGNVTKVEREKKTKNKVIWEEL